MGRDHSRKRRARPGPDRRTTRRNSSRAGTVCLVLATLGCGSGEAARGTSGGPPPPSVEVTVIEPEVLIDVVALTGQLYAENEVVLKPQIAGVVASIEFEEGQPVAAGDVLVTLRDERVVGNKERQVPESDRMLIYDRLSGRLDLPLHGNRPIGDAHRLNQLLS